MDAGWAGDYLADFSENKLILPSLITKTYFGRRFTFVLRG
jgi:hypothetical protein